MEWFYICLIICLCVIIMLFFPIFFSVKVFLDVCKNLMKVEIKLFFIPIKKMEKPIFQIAIKKKNKKNVMLFMLELLKLVKITFLGITCQFGKRYNVMQTVLVCGLLETILFVLHPLLNNCLGVNTKYVVKPSFFETKLNAAGKVNMVILPIDLLAAFVKTGQREKNKNAKK